MQRQHFTTGYKTGTEWILECYGLRGVFDPMSNWGEGKTLGIKLMLEAGIKPQAPTMRVYLREGSLLHQLIES